MDKLLAKTSAAAIVISNGWWVFVFIAPLLGLAVYYGMLTAERRLNSQRAWDWKLDPLLLSIGGGALAWVVHLMFWPVLDHWAGEQLPSVVAALHAKQRLPLLLFNLKTIGAYAGSLCLAGALPGVIWAGGRIGNSMPVEPPKEILTGTVIVDGKAMQRATAIELKKVKKSLATGSSSHA